MLPEKTNVLRLHTEALCLDDACNILWRRKRRSYASVTAIRVNKSRGYTRRRQNLEAKAHTKKAQAELASLDQELAEARKDHHNYRDRWNIMNLHSIHAYMKFDHAKIARLERLLRDAGGEW